MKSIKFENGCLYILNQTLLPADEVWNEFSDYKRIISALKDGIVIGDAAVAICAAYGYFLAAQAYTALPSDMFSSSMVRAKKEFLSINPMSTYLTKCLGRMEAVVIKWGWKPSACDQLLEEALQLHFEDIDNCKKMAVFGASLIPKSAKILTYSAGGGLSSGGYGTSLGVIKAANLSGKVKMVFICETRPDFCGSRLGAMELSRAGIPVTALADNSAARLMSMGLVDVVIAPCDKITANGDISASPGTYNLAVLCHHHGVPIYVAATSNVIDLSVPDGRSLPLAQGAGEEIRAADDRPLVGDIEIRVYAPAFDITPHWMITGIITEHGVIYPPFYEGVSAAGI